jgi:hypothetical protein
MFRFRLHPTPAGLAFGVLGIALWALMWLWFLTQVARGPQNAARQPGPGPELARSFPAAAIYCMTSPV